jgi:nicotinate-nucleotide pyrophosphorylase (carboxylating)
MENNLANFAIPKEILQDRLKGFLDQDIGFGDLSSSIIPADAKSSAKILAKSDGVIAGAEEAKILFEMIGISAQLNYQDGIEIKKGMILMDLDGLTRNILMIERTVLNILMKMSSIATSTKNVITSVQNEGYQGLIAATRKVTPGFGWFEKKAIYLGGGDPHRWNLSDMIMLKNTHLKYYNRDISKMIKIAKKVGGFSKKVEIEIELAEDVEKAITAGADIIMLDNMTPEEIKDIVDRINRQYVSRTFLIEASGNITHKNIIDYARSGVDVISTSELILHPHFHIDYSLRLK